MKKILLSGLIILGTLGLSACAPVAPVLEISGSGGMCVEGPCKHPSVTIYSDGSTSTGGTVGVERLTSLIDSSKLPTLQKDTQGFCPSYADGVDLVIRVPAWGSEVIRPCELKGGMDDPLAIEAEKFFYVEDAISKKLSAFLGKHVNVDLRVNEFMG